MTMAARTPLTRDRVIAAALDFVDANGVDALSMRKLGAALGVEAMSLYNHVSNKEDLLDGVADLLLQLVPLPERAGPEAWHDEIMALCQAVREMGRAHPRAFPLLVTQTRNSYDSWAPILRGFEILRDAGLPDAEAIQTVSTVSAYLVGSILFEISAISLRGGKHGPALGADDVPPDHPLLRAYLAGRRSSDFDEDFREGIALFLQGVAARVRASVG
jgi:AcrR family transcriptional regulator